MTRDEIIKAVGVIAMAYPAAERFREEKQLRNMVAVWAEFFATDDAGLVMMAIRQHISTSKWPPSIAEIRDIMVTISRPDIIPADEAWEIVAKYLDVQGEYDGGDYHAALPETIAEAIDAVGYGQLYALHVAHARGGKAGLDRIAFRDAYEGKAERERQKALLPKPVREQIEQARLQLMPEDLRRISALDKRWQERQEYYRQLDADGLDWLNEPAQLRQIGGSTA